MNHIGRQLGRWGMYFFLVLVVAFILLPIIVVMIVSFGEAPYLVFPPTALTGRWYAFIFQRPEWVNAMVVSLQLAAAATVGSLIFGSLASIAVHRHQFPGVNLVTSFFLSPLLIPGILIGMSILTLAALVGMQGRYELLVGGHILVSVPYLIRMVLASLPGAARSLEEAALTLGADDLTVLRRVTLPLIKPGLVAGSVFAFVTSFDNVSISLFLTRPTSTTLPVRILSAIDYSWDPSIAAVSTVSVIVGLLLMVVLARTVGLQMWVVKQTVEK